jgi:hypothetical protein
MVYTSGKAALLARYALCAFFAALASGCGGSGGSSQTGTPATLNDTGSATNPPTITGTPTTSVVVGTTYSFQPSASDTTGDALTFSIQNKPAWAAFDAGSGLLTGMPSASDVGTSQPITITVADGSAQAQLAAFTIQVIAAPASPPPATNHPPTLSGTPATSVQAGAHYVFQPSASDVDGNVLVFSVENLPGWASFSTKTGALSGTPATANVGTYSNIVINVSDGQNTVELAPFTITVTAVSSPPANTPPKITGTPATSVQAGSHYSFQPAASDADGNALTFSIGNKPSWATFSTTTGQLSGTPAVANVGAYANITITVSDGKANVSLAAFTVTVTAPAAAPPTISGTPSKTAQAGTAYSFTPQASSSSGKSLSFSIQNKPGWATFSIATGQLSGTPGSSDVGTDAGIVITVSDGSLSAALAAFTITVAAAPGTPTVGSATLHWSAPTQNTDGSSITNLAGYVIEYGMSAGALSQSVNISSATTTSYTIPNLGSGTWYFALSSVSTSGATSSLSSVVSKTIN